MPVADVWDIPLLNPKAKERVGYPTQKPILLIERIISLVTLPGNMVLDPFCGSGTTLVAAELLGRSSLGIDVACEAVQLSQQRLEQRRLRLRNGAGPNFCGSFSPTRWQQG